MGYRTYIASISKEKHEKIKNLSISDLHKHFNKDEKNDYIGIYDIVDKTLYEFGKYTDFDNEKFYKPVFQNKDTNEYYTEEHDFYIVNKDFLEHIIKHYTTKIQNIYKDLLEGVKESADVSLKIGKKFYKHIKDFSTEWLCLTPYNLKNGDEVTTSWKYEYSIFELVRIYKTFDFENNYLIYYGY